MRTPSSPPLPPSPSSREILSVRTLDAGNESSIRVEIAEPFEIPAEDAHAPDVITSDLQAQEIGITNPIPTSGVDAINLSSGTEEDTVGQQVTILEECTGTGVPTAAEDCRDYIRSVDSYEGDEEIDPNSELGNPRSSFWSSFMPRSFSAACSKQRNSGLSQLNAAVRRAVLSGPMKRLQERLLGSQWASSVRSKTDVWLLGVLYPLGNDDSVGGETYAQFLTDFASRIWFSYRKGFEGIEPSHLTSDAGWGCMIRSGQMLLAQALVCHYLGRSWRRNPSEPNDREYLKILQRFGDLASPGAPFSLHNILLAGGPYGLVGGSWLGPYALCRSLEALAHSAKEQSKSEACDSLLPMVVYVVSGDAEGERGGAPCICIDDVEKLFPGHTETTGEWGPLLLLVPLVLGLDKVNTRYVPSLWATFTFPQTLGIAGGKPGASTYLVGVQGDQVLYLDPHEIQQVSSVRSSDEVDVNTGSYHCSNVKKMPLTSIDPSLALGFYCRNREEFDDLCKRASDLAMESNGAPMFTVLKSCNKGGLKVDFGLSEDEMQMEGGPSMSKDDSAEEDWQIL